MTLPFVHVPWVRVRRVLSPVACYEAVRRRVVRGLWRRWARKLVGPVESVVDVGPGLFPALWLKARHYGGVEAHDEYAKILRGRGLSVRTMTAQDWAKQPQAVDVVVMGDVIEHMPKEEGLAVVRSAQTVARAIIVTMPVGYVEQDGGGDTDEWGFQGQHWQRHRSGWQPQELPGRWAVRIDPDFSGARGGAFMAVWQRDEGAWATKS
jgi:hypothetical protein